MSISFSPPHEAGAGNMRIEEEYQDVLQNIEFAVANIYRSHPDMTDYAVLRVYEALVQCYAAEAAGRTPKPVTGDELEALLFRNVKYICEWRLGRDTLTSDEEQAPHREPIDVPTLLLCLKRLVRSVDKWTRHGGRQGYLRFMTQFFR
jgi:hypothetical protein